MRLERFKDVLIPVDGIIYARYAKDYDEAHKNCMEEDTTRIYFFAPNNPGVTRCASFPGDCLDEFNEWFSKFDTGINAARQASYFQNPVSEPILKFSPMTQTAHAEPITPAHTLTAVHTDGSKETAFLDGQSSSSPTILEKPAEV